MLLKECVILLNLEHVQEFSDEEALAGSDKEPAEGATRDDNGDA